MSETWSQYTCTSFAQCPAEAFDGDARRPKADLTGRLVPYTEKQQPFSCSRTPWMHKLEHIGWEISTPTLAAWQQD